VRVGMSQSLLRRRGAGGEDSVRAMLAPVGLDAKVNATSRNTVSTGFIFCEFIAVCASRSAGFPPKGYAGIYSAATSGARAMRGSLKTSASSVLRVENSETTAPRVRLETNASAGHEGVLIPGAKQLRAAL